MVRAARSRPLIMGKGTARATVRAVHPIMTRTNRRERTMPIHTYDATVTVTLAFQVRTTTGSKEKYRARLTAESVALEMLRKVSADDLVITLDQVEV